MGNDLLGGLGDLGGLGGLVKGLSGLMPQDDPGVKVFNAQNEVSDLKKQEKELFAEIGQIAYEKNPSAYPQAEKLKLIQANLAAAQAQLQVTSQEQQVAAQAKELEESARRCPYCSTLNPEGVSFCQECGTKLGLSACPGCGQVNPPGTRFCGGCGASLA